MSLGPHYILLGLTSSSVTQVEIKAAYRRKAKETHPDKTGGTFASGEAFKAVLEAYEVLSDISRKASYDARFWRPPTPEPEPTRTPSPPRPSSFESQQKADDAFNDAFNNMNMGSDTRRPSPVDASFNWKTRCKPDTGGTTLYLGGLTLATSGEMIKTALGGSAEQIESIVLRLGLGTRFHGTAHAFIKFKTRKAALNVKELFDGVKIDGSYTRLGWARMEW